MCSPLKKGRTLWMWSFFIIFVILTWLFYSAFSHSKWAKIPWNKKFHLKHNSHFACYSRHCPGFYTSKRRLEGDIFLCSHWPNSRSHPHFIAYRIQIIKTNNLDHQNFAVGISVKKTARFFVAWTMLLWFLKYFRVLIFFLSLSQLLMLHFATFQWET